MTSKIDLTEEIANFNKKILADKKVSIQWSKFEKKSMQSTTLRKEADVVIYMFSAKESVKYVGVASVFYGQTMSKDQHGKPHFFGPRYASNYRGLLGTILDGEGIIWLGMFANEEYRKVAIDLVNRSFPLGVKKPAEKVYYLIEEQLIFDFNAEYNEQGSNRDHGIKVENLGLEIAVPCKKVG